MSGSLANPSAAAAGPVSKFHRSYSMGQGWGALAQQQHQHQQQQQLHQQQQQQPMAMAAMPLDGQPKVVYRRRNNSTSEGDGSLLMCYPSEHLRRLVPAKLLASVAVLHAATAAVTVAPNANDAQSGAGTGAGSKDQQQQQQLEQNSALLHRPAMAFMTQKHELDRLRGAMRRSLRIAACRIYALQALNWLLRSVTQGVCLHDLMWWFVSSLAVGSVELMDGKYEEAEPALEHPVAYTQISGRFAHLITQSLHVLLQSVADLTLHLPLGSPLQRVAIQCFGIRFRQADHQFLHSSHVFGNISKILSKSDEQNDAMAVSNVAGGGGGGQEIHCDAEHNIATATASGSHQQLQLQPGAKVIYYTDLAGMFEVTVSSRPAMAESLTDNSTETFWESDEEDRNKCKIIEMSMTKLSYACKFVLVHIDNSRDIQVSCCLSLLPLLPLMPFFVSFCLQNKVLNVVFYAGQSLGDTNLIKSVDVDQKACVWIGAKISDETCTHFRLELHGPENTLRVRQIKLLGLPASFQQGAGNSSSAAGEEHSQSHAQLQPQHPPMQVPLPAPLPAEPSRSPNLRLAYAPRIQQQICEAETLRVFRLITGQVFGKLISNVGSSDGAATGAAGVGHTVGQLDNPAGSSMLADSLDLREHMVGILFSRSKLSHLQKQVIVHIVHAIRKEAQRAKEDWELANLVHVLKQPPPVLLPPATQTSVPALPSNESSPERSRAPDTYCFEMLSMVLALSGSVVGRSYLSQQHGLLRDLLGLLHTGSDRVQRQVTALLRRILPEITPESFAELLGVQRLPPADYSIAHHSASDFDMSRLGLLDIFLAVIAKSLQLQVKVKTTSANAAGNPGGAGPAAVPGSATGASAPAKPAQVEKTPAFVRLCSSLDLSVQLLRSRPQTAEQLAPVAPPTSGSSSSGSSDPFRFDAAVPVKKESKRNLNQRWFLNGVISTKQAESIIGLIRDLASVSTSKELSQYRY